MSEEKIREHARRKGFHAKTLARWLTWDQPDRDALLRLAHALGIGENHLRDLMDWLEEMALRDRSKIHDILACQALVQIESAPRLGRADKLKRIKDEIRRLRFPRLANTEDAIRSSIRDLRLEAKIKLSVPPGLEGGRLRAELSAASHEEFKNLTAKLLEASRTDIMGQIFLLLAGKAPEDEAKTG